jgi:hypothetical protein
MTIQTAIQNYVKSALPTYETVYGEAKDLDDFLRTSPGDNKRVFISYQGFTGLVNYEDGMIDLRRHVYALWFYGSEGQGDIAEGIFAYTQANRKIVSSSVTMSVGDVIGSPVVTAAGLSAFLIELSLNSTDRLQ